jgi:hypothetical protein
MERGKLIRLDPEILEDYAGKTVKLRSPMFCRGKQYCNKCYGDLPYLIGIKNVGLTINAIGESLKRFSLKAFHDASVKTAKMDVLGNITPLRG